MAGAITRYETRMRARIGPVERDSGRMEKLVLSPTALEDMVRFWADPEQYLANLRAAKR